MRKWLALLLVCTLLFAFTACTKEPGNVSSDAGTTSTTAQGSTDASGDTQSGEGNQDTGLSEPESQPTVSTTTKGTTAAPTTTTTVGTQATNSTTNPPTTTTTTSTQSEDDEEEFFIPNISVQDYFQSAQFVDPATREDVEYLFHAPRRKNQQSVPLIIFLHGLGEGISKGYPGSAIQLVSQLLFLENKSAEYSTYTIAPVTPTESEGWWTPNQLEALKKLIYHLIDNYNIDPKRIYITGISMGGFTTCQLVSEMPPNTFAAAVPLSGAYNMAHPKELHNTAFRIYHSKNDPVVDASCSRMLYRQLVISGHKNVEYIEFENGDHGTPLYEAFGNQRDTFFPWLFSQRLP